MYSLTFKVKSATFCDLGSCSREESESTELENEGGEGGGQHVKSSASTSGPPTERFTSRQQTCRGHPFLTSVTTPVPHYAAQIETHAAVWTVNESLLNVGSLVPLPQDYIGAGSFDRIGPYVNMRYAT